jgi:hypothetical protein
MKLKLFEILTELIDLYSIEDMESKGITYKIDSENARRLVVYLSYKKTYYAIRILPVFNPKRPSINFGSANEQFRNLNFTTLTTSIYSSHILAVIFSFVRYWVDKYNVQEFEYGADGHTRQQLYTYYLEKHFQDFTPSVEKFGSADIFVWTKK